MRDWWRENGGVVLFTLFVLGCTAALWCAMGCGVKSDAKVETTVESQIAAVAERTQQIYEFTKGAKTKIDNSRNEVTWKLVIFGCCYLVTSKLANWLLVCFPRRRRRTARQYIGGNPEAHDWRPDQ